MWKSLVERRNTSMNCYIHPEREAEWTCAACGQPVCPECRVTLVGRVYCNPCAEKMYIAALHRPGWFEQHLNITLVGALLVSELIMSIVMTLLAPYTDAGFTEESLLTPSWFYGYLVGSLILFPVAHWVIRKKARNPWNILWLPAPFGFIMILLLSNMSKAPQNSPGNPRIS
jgi:hypothetical protein